MRPLAERNTKSLHQTLARLAREKAGSGIFPRLGSAVGSKNHIPQWPYSSEVFVDMFGRCGVMDAVICGAGDYPAERPEMQGDGEVFKNCSCIPQEVKQRNGGKRSREKGSGKYLHRMFKERLDPVKPERRGDVHVLVFMVQFVDGPQPLAGMLQAMNPVVDEIPHEACEQRD